MVYADSSEQASIFAEKALEEMRARGLTQYPNNYTLWYTFVSEAIPDLTLAITSLDKKQEPVSEHHCAELHQKFLGLYQITHKRCYHGYYEKEPFKQA